MRGEPTRFCFGVRRRSPITASGTHAPPSTSRQATKSTHHPELTAQSSPVKSRPSVLAARTVPRWLWAPPCHLGGARPFWGSIANLVAFVFSCRKNMRQQTHETERRQQRVRARRGVGSGVQARQHLRQPDWSSKDTGKHKHTGKHPHTPTQTHTHPSAEADPLLRLHPGTQRAATTTLHMYFLFSDPFTDLPQSSRQSRCAKKTRRTEPIGPDNKKKSCRCSKTELMTVIPCLISPGSSWSFVIR